MSADSDYDYDYDYDSRPLPPIPSLAIIVNYHSIPRKNGASI